MNPNQIPKTFSSITDFDTGVIKKLGLRHIKEDVVPDSTTPVVNETTSSPPDNNSPPVTS